MQVPIQGVLSFLFARRAQAVLSHLFTGTDLLPSTPGAVELQQAFYAVEETQDGRRTA